MTGAGISGVALVADRASELSHFMLQRLLRRGGLEKNHFYFATADEAGVEQIQRKHIKVIVPLGEDALHQVLGQGDIARWRGRTVQHPHLQDVWVVPTLQPSKLLPRHGDKVEADKSNPLKLRPPRFHGVWMRDVHHALGIATDGFSRTPVRYQEDPDPRVFEQFVLDYELALEADPLGVWLSWDIETFYKQKESEDDLDVEQRNEGEILRISFAFRPGHAVSVPWTPDYFALIRRLLRSRGIKVVWNGTTFDIPVVTAAGFEVFGTIYEGMDAYHLWQSDLPKGLEWVSSEATDVLPWKHLAQAEPAWYSCVDADVALRNMLWLRDRLRSTGQWQLFVNHVIRLMPILDAAGRRGNLVDTAKREEIRSELLAMRDQLVKEIQQFVPRVLFPRTRYEREPVGFGLALEPSRLVAMPAPIAHEAWDIVWEEAQIKVCSHCDKSASNKSEHFKGSEGPPHPKTGKPTRVKNPCKEAGAVIELKSAFVPRFLRLEEFNPNSSDQLKAYMRHFGHPLGVDKKDSTKETADANHLKALHKKLGKDFPLYSKALVVHKVSKTIGTYTPEPDADNLIHTQFVNSTATWRLGSRKVRHGTQIQNWGKRKDEVPTVTEEEKAAMKLVSEARKQIIARPGRKLVQIDSSAVEAVMQGYYMNDPEYMRLASKSIHAWLACRALGLEFTPANVDVVKEKHAGLYAKMKVVNYLTNFGGGPKLMADTYPTEFPTRAVAQATQDDLYRLLPTLRAYHHAIRWEAHTRTFLQTPWGYRHYYYDVFKPSWDDKIQFGKDSKRSVAFKPQNSNAAFQRDNLLLTAVSPVDGEPITSMVELDARWAELELDIAAERTWAQFMPTNVSVHDSLCLDCPIELVAKATESLLAIFTRPIPEMHNLRVGAEVEVGDTWADMERVARVVIDDYTEEHTAAGLPVLKAA